MKTLSYTPVATLLIAACLSACDSADENQRIVGLLESDRVELTAEVAEPITRRLVVEGESVAAGQLLVSQDPRRMNARIAEAEAVRRQTQARLDELIRGPRREQIEAAQAYVEGAERSLEFRRKEFARAEKVHARNLAAPEQLDRARADRDAAKADLDSGRARLEELLSGTTAEELRQAEANVAQAEARLATLAVDLERHNLTAPVAGVVDSILFEIGEQPVPGRPLLVLLPGSQPHARVFVPEALRVSVVPNTRAKVFVDGRDEPFDGRVRWIASESAFTPYYALTERDRGRLTFAAKIDILNATERLPEGVPVEVALLVD
jgi:HlyD family secretion protein